MKEPSPVDRQTAFLQYLEQHREDRGFMADLRSALIPALEHRCWPLLAQFNVLTEPRLCSIFTLVAVAYGVQPEAPATPTNFGATLRRLAYDGKDSPSQTFETGFRKILNCSDVTELSDQLPRFFKAARQKNVPLDHQRLLQDLSWWNFGNRVRLEWAQSYFGAQPEPEGEE